MAVAWGAQRGAAWRAGCGAAALVAAPHAASQASRSRRRPLMGPSPGGGRCSPRPCPHPTPPSLRCCAVLATPVPSPTLARVGLRAPPRPTGLSSCGACWSGSSCSPRARAWRSATRCARRQLGACTGRAPACGRGARSIVRGGRSQMHSHRAASPPSAHAHAHNGSGPRLSAPRNRHPTHAIPTPGARQHGPRAAADSGGPSLRTRWRAAIGGRGRRGERHLRLGGVVRRRMAPAARARANKRGPASARGGFEGVWGARARGRGRRAVVA